MSALIPGGAAGFGRLYRETLAREGACPLESGVLGALADNECTHGRLPSDPTLPCGCWPRESVKPLGAVPVAVLARELVAA